MTEAMSKALEIHRNGEGRDPFEERRRLARNRASLVSDSYAVRVQVYREYVGTCPPEGLPDIPLSSTAAGVEDLLKGIFNNLALLLDHGLKPGQIDALFEEYHVAKMADTKPGIFGLLSTF